MERVRIFVGRDRRLRGSKLFLCSPLASNKWSKHKLYPCCSPFSIFLPQDTSQPSCLGYQCYNKFIILSIDFISLNLKSTHIFKDHENTKKSDDDKTLEKLIEICTNEKVRLKCASIRKVQFPSEINFRRINCISSLQNLFLSNFLMFPAIL